jgi:hypothetical protein
MMEEHGVCGIDGEGGPDKPEGPEMYGRNGLTLELQSSYSGASACSRLDASASTVAVLR